MSNPWEVTEGGLFVPESVDTTPPEHFPITCPECGLQWKLSTDPADRDRAEMCAACAEKTASSP